MFDYRAEWGDAAVRRWLRTVGVENVADLFDLRIADVLGNGLKQGFPVALEEFRARIERQLAQHEALHVSDLAVDGHDVMRERHLAPGPQVGEILDAMLEAVIEDPSLNRRDALLEWLRPGERREPEA
jgi:hypothetical protein